MELVGQQKSGSDPDEYYSSVENDVERDDDLLETENSNQDLSSKNSHDSKQDGLSRRNSVVTKMDLYTLPMFQSAGVACRPPTNRLYNFHSWHLPDFGGCADILDVSLKNNSLGQCPFKPKYVALPLFLNTEKFQPVELKMADEFHKSIQCNRLLITNNPIDRSMISIYLASSSKLILQPQSLQDYLPNTACWESYFPFNITHKTHHSRTFNQEIIGLHHDDTSSILLVNCMNESTAIRLNHSEALELPFSYKESTTIAFKSKPKKEKLHFKNVCMNPYRPGILTYALDGGKIWELREYDLNSKQVQVPLTKYSCRNDIYSSEYIISALKSKEVVQARSYAIEGDFERIQSIVAFPNHLQNTLYTTNSRLGVFDSRCPDLDSTMIVEKSKLPTLYPLESFHGSIFSKLDDHQFYVLSDSHIRIFDLRYHNTVLNQLSHNLKMGKINSLESMILDSEINDPKEVVTINDGANICMSIFGKHPVEKNLVNPISCSPPMFASKPTDSFSKVLGSDLNSIHDNLSDSLISGLQMVKIEINASSMFEDDTPSFDLVQLVENGSLFYQRFYRFNLDDDINPESLSPYINNKISDSNPHPVPDGYIERMTFMTSDSSKANHLLGILKKTTSEATYHEEFDLVGDNGEIILMDVDVPKNADCPKVESEYEDPTCHSFSNDVDTDVDLTEILSKVDIPDINQEYPNQENWFL